MAESAEELLDQIANARPANEAEVETKILLHLFRLLGYKDVDRADKITVMMHFGREVKEKIADFVLYDGPERSLANALVTVEAKRVGESLVGAELQAKSYATWLGTPFLITCNGESIVAAQFIPGAADVLSLTLKIQDLPRDFDKLRSFVDRGSAVLAKERISYLAIYLPDVENLPPGRFFREYLLRLSARFRNFTESNTLLQPPTAGEITIPHIPVSICSTDGIEPLEMGVDGLCSELTKTAAFVYIEGQPGSGKSTLCRRVAATLAEQSLAQANDCIPVHINLARGLPVSAIAAFKQACEDLGLRVFPELFRRSLTNSHLVLLLDGLDELPRTTEGMSILERLLLQERSCSAILAARPMSSEHALAMVAKVGFDCYRIRGLNDLEIHDVLSRYIRDGDQVRLLLRRANEGSVPDLRSPMIALMAIRVANEIRDWHRLSLFSLYVEYIRALHRFFNAPTVRAGGSVSNELLLSVLSDAAVALRKAQASGYRLPLDELQHALSQQHGVQATAALLNCGIVTSESGRAVFIHRTFEEFGFAWRLVQGFRRNGLDGLVVPHLSEESLRMASSELREADEDVLRNGIGHADERVRRRAVGLLSQLHPSQETIGEIWRHIDSERSAKVWAIMARLLVRSGADGLEKWLRRQLPNLARNRMSSLTWAIRKAGDSRLLGAIFAAFGAAPQRHLALAAFDLGLSLGEASLAQPLARMYEASTPAARCSICRMLGRRHTPLRDEITPLLLQRETIRHLVAKLLGIVDLKKLLSSTALMVHAADILVADTDVLRARDRRKLREIGDRLKQIEGTSADDTRLIAACEKAGARQPGAAKDGRSDGS